VRRYAAGYVRDMGPLSAVAISVWLIIYGLSGIGWITASSKALGVIALIAAVIVLVDTFWARLARR
jgi:branched-subunit amino acid transport protein AzlD